MGNEYSAERAKEIIERLICSNCDRLRCYMSETCSELENRFVSSYGKEMTYSDFANLKQVMAKSFLKSFLKETME